MTAVDWRTLATEQAQREFADAQARLDDGLNDLATEAGRVQAAADEKFTDWYDANVLNPAQDEFERQCDEDVFNRHYPEPADGTRVEFEANRGVVFGAFREDVPEHEGGSWWLYGDDERRTWRWLVVEYQLRMDDLTVLVAVDAVCEALTRIVVDYPIGPGVGAGVVGDFHAWTTQPADPEATP